MRAYEYARAPSEKRSARAGTVPTSCWCDTRAVLLPPKLIGIRTYSCGGELCDRMNAEYERRKR